MKVFGYDQCDEDGDLLSLREVAFQGSPEELRKVALFFIHAADEMDRMGELYGHEHFSSFGDCDLGADIIVSK